MFFVRQHYIVGFQVLFYLILILARQTILLSLDFNSFSGIFILCFRKFLRGPEGKERLNNGQQRVNVMTIYCKYVRNSEKCFIVTVYSLKEEKNQIVVGTAHTLYANWKNNNIPMYFFSPMNSLLLHWSGLYFMLLNNCIRFLKKSFYGSP